MSLQELKNKYPWPTEKPSVLPRYSKGDIPEGWCHGNNVKMFETLVNENTKVIVDAGSWLGLSAWHFLRLAPNATIICLDTWQGSAEHRKNELLPVLYETFLANMWEYRDRIIPMRSNGLSGFNEICTQEIEPDLVYIDMAHDKESVVVDINMARLSFHTATICGDDYTWQGVKDALEYLSANGKLSFETYTTCWKLNK